MWEGLLKTPLGRNHPRKFIVSLAIILVACFAYVLLSAPTAHAADAAWDSNAIVYDNNTFTGPKTTQQGDGSGLPNGTKYYQYEPPVLGVVKKLHIIYFAPGADPPTATQATYAVYDSINGQLSNKSNVASITLDSQAGTGAATDEGIGATGCAIDGIGWIVCSVSRFLAGAMDYMYGVISEFLEVQPLQTTQDGPIYRLWDVMRNFANVLFVIGFLILIYAQISGALMTNYTIKKMLPRIIVAAILVNVSYWICAVAVDISNILGYSVQDLFISIREATIQADDFGLTWENMTEIIITGGTATLATGIVGAAALTATGGSIIAAAFLLLPVLAGVIMAALVAIVVLAMRQALITILIIIAPLAFVAYMLPNTEKWFERWRGLFLTMLFLFPIFSAIFGGSQLAGMAIMQAAGNSVTLVILGMVVQVAPLIITPLVVKFSGSLLGRIAGMLNNPNKGLIDRTRNWANPRAEMHRDKNLAQANTGIHRYGAGRLARRSNRGDIVRKKRQEAYQKQIENAAHDYEPNQTRSKALNDYRSRKSYGHWDDKYRDADQDHQRIEAKHGAHWQQKQDIQSPHFNRASFDTEVARRKYADQAKLAENRMETAYTEMQAGRDPYQAVGIVGPTTQKLQNNINEVQLTAKDISLEALKKQSAEVVIQGNLASDLKADELTVDGQAMRNAIREYAGGVQGEAGATRVFAKATSDIVGEYIQNVKNARSLLSEYSANELIKLSQTGVDRQGKIYADKGDALRIAAQQEILLTKGNNWAFQKEKDYVAQMGMIYDENSTEVDASGNQVRYFTVERDGEGNALRNPDGSFVRKAILNANGSIDQDEIGRRRDTQQMFVDAVKNSKLKIASISGTDRSNMETGLFVDSGKQAIIRDAREGKIKPDRWAGMDYDEMMRTVQLMRENGPDTMRGVLGDAKLAEMRENIDTTLTDPRLNVHLENRQIEVLKMIQGYADAGARDLADAEKLSIEGPNSKVPRDYDYRTPYEYGGPTGPV